MNMTYGIGGALRNIGGSMMSMAFSNMQDKKLEERKRQADEAERLLEEKRVARTSKPFRTQADPNAQSPWVSKEASGYVTPQGKPSMKMVEEFNSSGRPIGMRPASESESFAASQEEAALLKAQQEAEMKRAREEEEFGMKKEKHKSGIARDAASIEASRASAASSRAYAENLKSGGLSGRPTVDPFKEESDLAYLVGTKEGGAGIDAEYQAELAKAVNGAQAMGVDEAKLALTRREIARIFINKLKRLPNKAKEE